ncbi:MAG: DUF4262 domain-containing protein [Candidatus Accumulibacter sp.]|mgnify:FL=1|jgi:hypothetical protein|uniref:DUF4262 domain-containing protein n=1 Tax=Accumulibacter sp. TaxID=2053492 RepID=UPI001ACF2FE2|nr:DUF4262 domain-containing protein [Accumulibacter sp.]MBK8115773.1 DUF4262 domain-containing protein [Accumulibacter sp.]MBN8437367.1 DUF4262 domain-containing protein [Accumulibacter sp.]
MEEYERNILQHIEEYGCSVTSVFDPQKVEPPFSYSIGIARSSGAPELIIIGLSSKLSHWMVNEYNRRIRSGEQFLPGVLYLGFLEGFAVQFGPVAREHRAEYMRSACWLHGGSEFDALQLIWPSTSGVWPWDAEASDWLRANQPLLAGEVA